MVYNILCLNQTQHFKHIRKFGSYTFATFKVELLATKLLKGCQLIFICDWKKKKVLLSIELSLTACVC